MARGEVLITCPHCGSQSRIPVAALQHNNYHCSRCGARIPLTAVKIPTENEGHRPSRSRSKRPFNRRKRR